MEEVEQTLRECEFLRLEHPPYSRDLSLCDLFFLVVFMKMKLLSYKTIGELEDAMTKANEGIPKETLIGIAHAWRRRLEQCIQSEGNYFE
jgi:hypothetical protein